MFARSQSAEEQLGDHLPAVGLGNGNPVGSGCLDWDGATGVARRSHRHRLSRVALAISDCARYGGWGGQLDGFDPWCDRKTGLALQPGQQYLSGSRHTPQSFPRPLNHHLDLSWHGHLQLRRIVSAWLVLAWAYSLRALGIASRFRREHQLPAMVSV